MAGWQVDFAAGLLAEIISDARCNHQSHVDEAAVAAGDLRPAHNECRRARPSQPAISTSSTAAMLHREKLDAGRQRVHMDGEQAPAGGNRPRAFPVEQWPPEAERIRSGPSFADAGGAVVVRGKTDSTQKGTACTLSRLT